MFSIKYIDMQYNNEFQVVVSTESSPEIKQNIYKKYFNIAYVVELQTQPKPFPCNFLWIMFHWKKT